MEYEWRLIEDWHGGYWYRHWYYDCNTPQSKE